MVVLLPVQAVVAWKGRPISKAQYRTLVHRHSARGDARELHGDVPPASYSGRSPRLSSLDVRSIYGQANLPADALFDLQPYWAIIHLRDILRLSTALSGVAVLGSHAGNALPRGYRGQSRSVSRLGSRRSSARTDSQSDGSSLAGVAHVSLNALWSLIRVDASVQVRVARGGVIMA